MSKLEFKAKDFGTKVYHPECEEGKGRYEEKGQVVLVLDEKESKYKPYFKKEDGFVRRGRIEVTGDKYSVYTNGISPINKDVNFWILKELRAKKGNYEHTFSCYEVK